MGAFNPKQSEQEKLSQLITDLKSFGVKLPDTLEATNIEKVIYIYIYIGTWRTGLHGNKRPPKQRANP